MPVFPRRALPADARGIARVHVASWRMTYAGIVPAATLANLSEARRVDFWQHVLEDPASAESVFVVEDAAGQIAGFASCGPNRGDEPFAGELYAIYLLRSAQGQDIGEALTRRVMAELLARGMPGMILWVLAENPARGFYERMGGVLTGEKMVTIGGKALREVAYAWDDLATMLRWK
jgi:ribosomal protein S18 acetylase RimI-like enzyme